jgi:lipoprotein-anchoring transpeptidase ErfK/SrfK
MLIPRRLLVVCALAVTFGFISACGASGDSGSSAPPSTAKPPAINHRPFPPESVLVAEAQGRSIAVYPVPGQAAPELRLPNPWLLNGVAELQIPQVFLARRLQSNGWVEVELPTRPNGGVGWIRPGAARLVVDQYAVSVSLSTHRITVFRLGKPVYSGPAATGAPATPTPQGLFYVRVLLRTNDPDSPYGPYAYGLSAHSNALSTFDGSDAEIGLHGNNDPSVLGQSVTHGCVRMDNSEISRLASLLPLGTPVMISA